MTNDQNNISFFSLTAGGSLLALKLRDRFGGTVHLPRCQSLDCRHCDPFDSIAKALPERFRAGDTLICVMAAGIAIRVLAPYLRSKRDDPAVIVLDEEGRHVVPLLGGHAAGANRLAGEIAAFLGGEAVITTASDVRGLIAPDEVARRLGLAIDDPMALRRVTALLVDGKTVCIESREDPGVEGYGWVPPGGDTSSYEGRLLISHLKTAPGSRIPAARLIPRTVVAGIGCRRGTPAGEIVDAIETACDRNGVDARAVGMLASIDIKRDETGILEAAATLGTATTFYPAAALAGVGRPGSDFVAGTAGTPAVCEPAALLAAGGGDGLISSKEVFGRVTVALAVRAHDFDSSAPSTTGRVFVVGTGAGTGSLLTTAAYAALNEADVIMGYRTYVEQMRTLFPGKEFIAGSMGAEIDRCREALSLAAGGRTVAMVSSGDPGVYGMAGPLLELADGVPVKIVPGVTAAQIAAASLGAPLMNDFITLSLSDLLTPREEVLRRAHLAAASDLAVCLYNPTSRKRRPLFEEVCRILNQERPPATPVGWVREAGSPGETAGITTLAELAQQEIDMRTIVIIGNSRTEIVNGRMVTGRGYENRER
jgi:cobalt-precorrin 5A hydrolase/precorrin-3B C17-methyltransferase